MAKAARPSGLESAVSAPDRGSDRGRVEAEPSWRSGRRSGLAAVALAAALFASLFIFNLGGAGAAEIDLAWARSFDLRLHFALDGIGVLYGLLATGVGALVLAYSVRYLPRHLEHDGGSGEDGRVFYALLGLFMLAMVGLAAAQDLIVLFVFFDLTAVCSYFLIGFHRHQPAARWAALVALVVTAVSAVCLLVAAVLLHGAYGTFSVPELADRLEAGRATTAAALLILVAALTKSAQIPFHFWLRRAMVAPTPVSAYLHSAAMVAAGVLLLGRLFPLLAPSRLALDVLLVAGFASIAIGGVLALSERELKPILAYSTVSQYGYVTAMYGMGGAKAVSAAALYVLMHGVAKSALFLTAGAVTEATGESRIDRLGGLARRVPILAVASGVAAAAVAAVPLNLGFFADELFFGAAIERGPLVAGLSVVAAILTLTYMGRFWLSIFAPGRTGEDPGRKDLSQFELRGLVWPVAVLAGVLAVGGFFVGPFADLAQAAGAASLGSPAPISPAYHLDLRAENVMALAAYAGGAVILPFVLRGPRILDAAAALGRRIGPDRAFGAGLGLLNRLSDAAHSFEVRDLRTRVVAVLVPGGVLMLLGVATTPFEGTYAVGGIEAGERWLPAILIPAVVAAVAATRPRRHLRLVLSLSAAGFALAAVYAFLGAPDVALVAVLVELVLGLLFLATLGRLPSSALRREARIRISPRRRRRDLAVAVGGGLAATAVVWGALSRPSGSSIAEQHVELAPSAHGKDVVTVILADFRALDTVVEVTVVAVALLGLVTLLRGLRPS